ncbi:MLt-TeN (mlt-10) related [Caenorhabditis elegans]|uniref:MLt-TeN (Mlt-10) related n=1 Tax=Caenorhabditis elegans TaxID=6239 RepID=G4SQS3_CAEEL|nr:MLt-TeN (mlt-10) related [Caenorhabditis elegans]CCD74312.1 MLt-TeN (mlt-10) related [Caenorhabditis elegans]|eukprot:NP_001255985.1 MLt-TeN (mlt-10) related [Caenorhabditis elegans]
MGFTFTRFLFVYFLVGVRSVSGSIISRREVPTVSTPPPQQSTLLPNFPWLENIPKFEFTTSKPKKPNAIREGLIEQVRSGKIPKELAPFVNLTKIDEMKKEHQDTLDFIIRDEDVADVPDDDVEHRKVNTLTHDGNKTIITISDEARDDLYKHWVDQSLAGLMGAVVTNVINKRKMTKSEKKDHYICINESKNVTAHAKCVVVVLDQRNKRNEKLKMYSTLATKLNSHRKRTRADNDIYKTRLDHYDKYVKSGAEEYRVKRAAGFSIFDEMENKRQAAIRSNVQTRKSYTIRENKSLSPLALIARKLTELVRAGKNKQEPPKRWQQVIQEIKDESFRIKGKKNNKERMKRKFSKFVSTMKEAGLNPRKALNTMGMEDLFEDDPILSEKEMDLKDRKEMEERMSPDDKIMHEPIKLIREAIKIGMAMAGKNGSEIGDKKVALLSPQFMSILPDEVANDTVSLFSPSILSLHGEGTDLERSLSLTKALRLMEDTGQEEWMNFVLEASGVTETVEKMRIAEEKEQDEERRKDFVDKDGRPMYFTKENVTEIYGEYEATKIDLINGIYKTMSKDQLDALNSTGYSIMDDKQLDMLYGPGSPYNNSEALDKFRGIPLESMPDRIEQDIRLLAREEMKFELSRKKDIVLNPLVLSSVVNDPVTASQSLILSPILIVPIIFSPSIYGNVILSPWIFVPVLVSPRILGAVILSPVIMSPAILTPLCMVPIILSPGVGLPFILSPFILSPFILSPVVMAPLVLSPFALSPFIGIPNALTPLILSPFVLSPLVLSPPFVSAFVLNPYALSPAVLSNGAVFTAVLSPSWLSTL